MFIKNLLSFFAFSIFFNSYSTRLHICTVATERTPGFINLQNSCASLHLNLTALGMGKDYPGNYIKLHWTKEFIASLPKDDILLFVDGYDVIILAKEDEIIRKFRMMDKPFIIGAEPVLYPYKKHILNQYPKSQNRFRFINSGCYIGYVSRVEEILNDLLAHYADFKCDQRRTHEHFVKNKKKYTLDSYCNLFLNLSRVPFKHLEIDYNRKRVFHKPTRTMPIAIHGCGLRKPFIFSIGGEFFGHLS